MSPPLTDREKVELLYRTVLARWLVPEETHLAIITAIEGMRWIIGEHSAIDEAWLRNALIDLKSRIAS